MTTTHSTDGPRSRRYALSFSGGKDSMLALDRALAAGLEVAYLFNIYEGVSGLVRFHGVPAALILAQARSLGIPLRQDATHPDGYETVFLRLLDTFKGEGIDGVIFGNVHLVDIRAWYEERVIARGFEYVEPLWGETGEDVVRDFIGRGHRARVASIDLTRTPRHWLGRPIDEDFLADLGAHPELDACGERGEYHTFVEDSPLFRHPVRVQYGPEIEMEGHLFRQMADV
jgi:uncharacterized protein (TIGR00290 family)